MDSLYKRKPFIYMPRKKKIERAGGKTVITNSANLRYTRPIGSGQNSLSTFAIIDTNPLAFSPQWTLRGKRVFVERTGSANRVLLARIYCPGGDNDFESEAARCSWAYGTELSSWSMPYVWYVKSQDTNVYKLKKSSGNVYQHNIIMGSHLVAYIDKFENYTGITDINASSAFQNVVGANGGGSLIVSDYNMTSAEILPYVNGLGYGTKSAVVDLTI